MPGTRSKETKITKDWIQKQELIQEMLFTFKKC